jgi:hypothetical protein
MVSSAELCPRARRLLDRFLPEAGPVDNLGCGWSVDQDRGGPDESRSERHRTYKEALGQAASGGDLDMVGQDECSWRWSSMVVGVSHLGHFPSPASRCPDCSPGVPASGKASSAHGCMGANGGNWGYN